MDSKFKPGWENKKPGRILRGDSSLTAGNYPRMLLAGQVGLMNALKQEGRKYNIKVNTLAPIAATRMTESIMPPAALQGLRPELVTPAVLFMLSKDAPSGAIITAGAGFFAAAKMVEAQGALLKGEVTADDVAANWDKISDFTDALTYESVNDGIGRVFKMLKG